MQINREIDKLNERIDEWDKRFPNSINFMQVLNPDGTSIEFHPPEVTYTDTWTHTLPRTCAKCTTGEVTTKYRPLYKSKPGGGSVKLTDLSIYIVSEDLFHKCTCGWQWSTPCDDAGEKEADKEAELNMATGEPLEGDLFSVTFKKSLKGEYGTDTVSGIYSQLGIDRYLEANPDYCMIEKDPADYCKDKGAANGEG